MSFYTIRYVLLALVVCLGFGSCRYFQAPLPEPVPLVRRLTWDGLSPDKYAVSPVSQGDSGFVTGLKDIHEFEFAGTDSVRLQLRQYDQAHLAFAGFQKRATHSEMSDGYFRKGNGLVFFHGIYAGELRLAHGGMVPAHFLREKLSFQGEPLFLPPPEFATFPLLGRIPHSERVITAHFLGRNWQGPVFSVSYRCHGDTVTAFRAKAYDPKDLEAWLQRRHGSIDTIGWGKERELRFQGRDEFQRPLVFWIRGNDVVGMEGCFDKELAMEYTRKLSKIQAIEREP